MVRFNVLTAMNRKMAVFWDAAILCNLVEVIRSEMPVNVYQTVQHNVPEENHCTSTSYLHFSFIFIYSYITFQTAPFQFLYTGSEEKNVSEHSNISGWW